MAGEKLETVPSGSLDPLALFSELKTFKEQALKRLQQECFAEESRLESLKRQIEETQKQATVDANISRQKVDTELRQQADSLQAERKSLERLDLEVEARRKDVEGLEAKAVPIQQALQKLSDERIAIEQQRVRNEELRVENDRLYTSTSAMHEEVNQLKTSLLASQTQVQTQLVLQEQEGQRLAVQATDIALQMENLTALKETLDPKLIALTALQAKADANQKQAEVLYEAITAKEAETAKQKADLAILSSQLEAKASALTEYDASLKRADAELRIKIQQAKVAVDLPTLTGEPVPVA